MININNIDVSYDFFGEYSEKMFAGINAPTTLLNTLRAYTKNELNIIRRELQFPGLSTLNKEKLAVVLEENIKKDLSDILKKFTEVELLFIKDMLKNNGIVHFKEEFINELQYLRRFGIVGIFKCDSGEKYIYIPNDIISDINELLIDMNILTSQNESESQGRLLKGNSLQQILSAEKGQAASLPMKPAQAVRVKIGRNSPCPCGSGKKFKFCCLK